MKNQILLLVFLIAINGFSQEFNKKRQKQISKFQIDLLQLDLNN